MKLSYTTLMLAICFANVIQQGKGEVVPPKESTVAPKDSLGESIVAAKPPESLLNVTGSTAGSVAGPPSSPSEDVGNLLPTNSMSMSMSMSQSGSGDMEAGASESSSHDKGQVGENSDNASSSISAPLLAIALIVPVVQWLL